jgi:hypothetical protein
MNVRHLGSTARSFLGQESLRPRAQYRDRASVSCSGPNLQHLDRMLPGFLITEILQVRLRAQNDTLFASPH